MDNEILRDYLLDAKEHLDRIESIAIGFDEAFSTDELNELFRAFHTLKGNAAIMGLAEVKDLSHEAENMIGDVRSRTIPMSKGLTDLVLASVDLTRRIHLCYEKQGKNCVEFAPLVGQIRSFRNTARKEAAVAAADKAGPGGQTAETRLTVKRIEDLAIIEVPAEFLQDHSEGITALFESLAGRGMRRLVLDFRLSRKITPENARSLIAAAAAAAKAGIKSAFCGIHNDVIPVLAAQPGAANIANLPTLRAALKDLGAL